MNVLAVPMLLTGMRKSAENRLSRTLALKLLVLDVCGTGIVDGIKESANPAGLGSNITSVLRFPLMRSMVWVPGSTKNPGNVGSSGALKRRGTGSDSSENVSFSEVSLPTASRCCSEVNCTAGGNGGIVLSMDPVCRGTGT